MKHKVIGIILDNGLTIKQISKRKALQLFLSGKEVYLMPSNLLVHNPWPDPTEHNRSQEDFGKLVDSFEFYNCNSETGLHAHFFTDSTNI